MLTRMDGFSGIADFTADVDHPMMHVKYLAGRRWQEQKGDLSPNYVIKFYKTHPTFRWHRQRRNKTEQQW